MPMVVDIMRIMRVLTGAVSEPRLASPQMLANIDIKGTKRRESHGTP